MWSMDGRPGRTPAGAGIGGSTVVVQYVDVDASRYSDVNGSPTPYARTVGKGRAVVLRDGRSWQVDWSRPRVTSGTTFTVGGKPADFAGGQIWVVLAPGTSQASLS